MDTKNLWTKEARGFLKVMEKAVGFRPIVTMVAILAGGQIFGIMGALLAVPVSLIISIIFKYIYSSGS